MKLRSAFSLSVSLFPLLLAGAAAAQRAGSDLGVDLGVNGFALAWCDYDGDGLVDVLATRPDGAPALLRNLGLEGFADVTALSGLGTAPVAHLARWRDVDGDGRPDLYLAGGGGGATLRRNAPGGFELFAELPGAVVLDAGWIDLDGDRLPDLVQETAVGFELLRNQGGGAFTPVGFAPPEVRVDGLTAARRLVERRGRPGARNGASGEASLGAAPPPSLGGTPGTTGGPAGTNAALTACLETLRDQATGACLDASSVPVLGSLWPLSVELNVDAATGFVGIGTAAPVKMLHVAGDVRADGGLGVVGNGDFSGPVTFNDTASALGLLSVEGDAKFESAVDFNASAVVFHAGATANGAVTLAGGITGQHGGVPTVVQPLGGFVELASYTFDASSFDGTQDVRVTVAVNGPGALAGGGSGWIQTYRNSSGISQDFFPIGGSAQTQTFSAEWTDMQAGETVVVQAWADGPLPLLVRDVSLDVNPQAGSGSGTLGGSGTSGKLALFSGATTLTSAAASVDGLGRFLFDDDLYANGALGVGNPLSTSFLVNGSTVTVGGQTPAGLLQVKGALGLDNQIVLDGLDGSVRAEVLDTQRIEGNGPVKVVGDPNWGSLIVTPGAGAGVYNENAELVLAEGENADVGMRFVYDGGTNQLSLEGFDLAGTYGPKLTVDRNLGRVGINNPTPGGALDVVGSGIGTNEAVLKAYNTAPNGIAFFANAASTDATAVITQNGTGPILRGFGASGIVFEVKANGRVVTSALEITGGGDLVEAFDSDVVCAPGMVVVIDPERPGRLKPSESPYDSKVAGAVSGAGGVAHGIQLSQEGVLEGDTLVAMTGRVYVHCTTEGGAIQPGDLLTTSSTRGHAMRAADRERSHGAVIGKAMSALDGERGLVLVLVDLQ